LEFAIVKKPLFNDVNTANTTTVTMTTAPSLIERKSLMVYLGVAVLKLAYLTFLGGL